MKNILIRLSIFTLLFPFVTIAQPLLYVPTGNTNDVVIIDLSTDKIIGRIDELENAHGLSSSRYTEYLVAGSMQAPGTKKSAAAKPAKMSEAEHAEHHANTKSKAEKTATPSYVSIIHAKHGHVMRRVEVGALTHHTAVSPDGKIAIAVHSGAGDISVIDLDKMNVIKILQTGTWPNYAVFSSDGNFLYITNAGMDMVSEINTRTWQVTREINVGKAPEHMVISTDNKFLYVANKTGGSVSVVNLTDGNVTKTWPVGEKIHGIDLSDDGRWLFVASKGTDTLSRINLSNGKVSTIDLLPSPYHVAYITGLNKLYVSSRKIPKIWVLNPQTLHVENEIDLGKGVAHQMVIRSNNNK
ncbi:MAG: beta-propeller fold lactonase family protein [Gammaproteobacteria bacterium]|nr:beta-propeller fold lactonase family protein [Gammaproteobacteria bacterium]